MSLPKRPKSESPLVLSCLGGNPPENLILDSPRYAISLIRNPLRKMSQYLNFSELLSIIDEYSYFNILLRDGKDMYGSLKQINRDFFPKLNGRIHYFSEHQKSRLKKLDVYGKKKSLIDRIDAIPDNLKKEIVYEIVYPATPIIETKVPLIKKKGCGRKYAEIRAKEISKIINTFSREYFPEFC